MALVGKAQRGGQSFGGKLLHGLRRAAKFAGTAHTIYQVGRALYGAASALGPIGPLAATALL